MDYAFCETSYFNCVFPYSIHHFHYLFKGKYITIKKGRNKIEKRIN